MEEAKERKCQKCRDWGDCPGKDSYSPSEIQFCRWQMMWLLRHLKELQNSEYPSLTSSYLDWPPVLGKGAKSGAYFETPVGLAAIVTERLERTGKKLSKSLLDYILKVDIISISESGEQRENIFKLYKAYGDMSRDQKWALLYISGRWPKKEPYYHWRWRKHGPKS